MDNKKTKKIIILAVLINALVLAVWLFLAYSVFKEGDQLKQISSEISTINTKKENLQNLTSIMKNTEIDRGLINSYFVDSSSKADFIARLEQMAKDSGVALEVSGAQEDLSLKFDLNLTGSFASIYQYLLLVENLPYRIDVEKINFQFSPLKEAGGSGRWVADLVINIISYRK